MKKYILSVFFLVLLISSCKKELPIPGNGIYRGVFNEIYDATDTISSGVVFLALWESSNTFQLVGDSLSLAPASHGGGYVIQDASRIIFTNKSTYNPIYNLGHYLDTTYRYFFDDEIFEFAFEDGETVYEYRLKRD